MIVTVINPTTNIIKFFCLLEVYSRQFEKIAHFFGWKVQKSRSWVWSCNSKIFHQSFKNLKVS